MSKKLTDRHEIALYSLYGRGEHMKMVTVFTEDDEDYTRLTEPLEVQFAYLPDEVVVPGKIDSLQAQANRVRQDMTRQLADIDEEINKLRAITFQPEED